MPEDKPRRKAAPRQPKTTSTSTTGGSVNVVPQVDPYEAASKQLTDHEDRLRKVEEALATALGITL